MHTMSFSIPENLSKKAMILAAGFGKRLAPLTHDTPKPLLKIGETTLLDYHRNILKSMGFEEAVINTHYLGDQITKHLHQHPFLKSQVSFEKDILDSGGGIKNVVSHFDKPFLCINADVFTTGPLEQVLVEFIETFDTHTTDVFLLLIKREDILGYESTGDFFVDGDRPELKKNRESAPFVYTGIQILNPRFFDDFPLTSFSIKKIWESAMAEERCHAHVVKESMTWFDTGTHEGFALANTYSINLQKISHTP